MGVRRTVRRTVTAYSHAMNCSAVKRSPKMPAIFAYHHSLLYEICNNFKVIGYLLELPEMSDYVMRSLL